MWEPVTSDGFAHCISFFQHFIIIIIFFVSVRDECLWIVLCWKCRRKCSLLLWSRQGKLAPPEAYCAIGVTSTHFTCLTLLIDEFCWDRSVPAGVHMRCMQTKSTV